VTTDRWAGFEHAAALAEMAPRLPALRHRVVLGKRVGDDEVDLDRAAERGRDGLGEPVEDADRVAMVLFTSGTSGDPKAVLHSFNTILGAYGPLVPDYDFGPDDVFFTLNGLASGTGQNVTGFIPLYVGGRAVITDIKDPDSVVGLLGDEEVTFVFGAPVSLSSMAEAVGRRSRKLPALRRVVAGGTIVPAELVEVLADRFGITLQSVWGMTEVGSATSTSLDDPPGWAAKSVGRPHAGAEFDLRAEGPEVSLERPARLFVRGALVCLAMMGRDDGETYVPDDHDEGWYDTGDLAVPDGRGGVRIVGRAADRIGGSTMIPVADVEDALRTHADIVDVALVGYGEDQSLACAVVVARTPVTLEGLRSFLDGIGMTDWYQPVRLEVVDALPYNTMGKVRKELLRCRLRGEAARE
jgi:cyclohexanecarboxylate-CoA ligase